MNRGTFSAIGLVAGVIFALCTGSPATDVWTADPIMGDYEGSWTQGAKGRPREMVAQVIPRGEGRYRINLLPEFDMRCPPYAAVDAQTEGKAVVFENGSWSGRIERGILTGKGPINDKQGMFELKKTTRPSPRLGAPPPDGAIVLFDGSGFDHWTGIENSGELKDVTWKLVNGAMEVAPTLADHGFATSIATKQPYRDYHLHLEFRLPLFANVIGQSRSNSGIIFEDYSFHELQVLDSYGLPGYYDECGGIYKVSGPQANMCRPPQQWQSYDIEYHAPRYADDGALLQAGSITVNHNGTLVQTALELPDRPYALRQRQEKPNSRTVGRIKLQNHGDPVQYRNIWLKELSK